MLLYYTWGRTDCLSNANNVFSRGNLHTGFLGLFVNGLARTEDRLRTIKGSLLVNSECTVYACYIYRIYIF